jgi:ABC-type sugar transport system permease subunit
MEPRGMSVFTKARSKYLFPAAVLLPIAAWYVIFMYYPTFYSLWASLHLWVAENPSKSTFIGLKNYAALFTTDPRFQKAITNTFIYVFAKTAIVVPVGMIIALLLEKLHRGTKVYVFAIFLPALCSATAIGILFNYLYQPSFGLFNAILRRLSLPVQPFLSSAVQAIYCVILTDAWAYLGFTTPSSTRGW